MKCVDQSVVKMAPQYENQDTCLENLDRGRGSLVEMYQLTEGENGW